MRILLLEDDAVQAEFIESKLRTKTNDVEVIQTERGFRQWLRDPERTRPGAIIVDIMLRWTDPEDIEGLEAAPEEVRNGSFYRAGLRCVRLVLEDAVLSELPIILYSVLEQTDVQRDLQDLPSRVSFLRKDSDVSMLADAVKRAVERR